MRAILGVVLAAILAHAAGPPPLWRNLTPAEQKDVSALRSQVVKHADAGEFEQAVKVLEEIAAYRTRRQGAMHWQAIDARWDVVKLRPWVLVTEKDRPLVAQARVTNTQGVNLYGKGSYREAEKLLREALDLYRKTLGEEHANTAQSYNNVASSLEGQGKHSEALLLFQKALDIRRKVLGELHPDTATTYNSLAKCLNDQGRHTDAVPLFQKALDIRLQVLGELHPQTSTSYNTLALCLLDQGRPADAIALLRKALNIKRQVNGELHIDTTSVYHNIALCLTWQGRHGDARPLLQKALDITRQVHGELHPRTIQCYNNLGLCLDSQGRQEEALLLFQTALDICQKTLGERHPHTARSYSNVADVLNNQGKHLLALPLLQKALDIRRQVSGERHPDTATSYNKLAKCLNDQGRHTDALPLFQKALDIDRQVLGEHHPDTAKRYNSVAYCLHRQGNNQEALPLLQRALDISRRTLGEWHPDTAITYNIAASCLERQGKYADAARYYARAMLGHEFGRITAASTGFDRALFRTKYFSPRIGLALCLVKVNQGARAWDHAESDFARGLLDELPGSARPDGPDASLARVNQLHTALVPFISRADFSDSDRERRDALTAERDKLMAEVAEVAVRHSRDRVLPRERIQQHIPRDAAVVFWLDGPGHHFGCVVRRDGDPIWVPLPGSGAKSAGHAKASLLTHQTFEGLQLPAARCEQLIRNLSQQRIAPLEPHLQGVTRLIVVPNGQMSLVPVEALTDRYVISYTPSATVYARLAERHRPLSLTSLLLLADPEFKRPHPKYAPAPPHGLLVTGVPQGSPGARVGVRPGDVILEFADKKPASRKDLKIKAGDAPISLKLWREGRTGGGFTLASDLGVEVDERPVGQALAAWRGEQAKLQALLGGGEWGPLPGTRSEARALTVLVPTATVLLGSRASEQSLEQLALSGKLSSFRLLHLATHGEANADRPLNTALILAQDRLPTEAEQVARVQAGQKPMEGRLSVETILRTWNLDADLVTLSACETGLGMRAGGEGMLGFAQALLQKNARSVVLSRWKVDDTATSLLMRRFYENLLGSRADLTKPLPRAEALWDAKRWLRDLPQKDARHHADALRGKTVPLETKAKPVVIPAGDKPFAHPYYWAAFILIGDPN